MLSSRHLRLGATAVAIASLLAACSGGESDSGADVTSAAPDPSPATSQTSALAAACPATIDAQLPWWPGVDYAFLFQLIGDKGTIDADNNTYTGEIGDTGVTLELRSGGPAAGFQTAQSLLYQDDSIYLIVDSEAEQVDFSVSQPTVSVFSYYDTYPVVFEWGNPDWDFQSLADIKASGATILASGFASYLTALESSGDIDAAQVDPSWDGSPSQFIAAGGNAVQQDYITTGPYLLEHATPAWNKPVKFISLASDFPIYGTTVQVRKDKVEEYSPCLKVLVPLLQQAAVDYAADPSVVNGLLVDYSSKLAGIGVVPTEELLTAANAAQLKYGLVRNGTDGVLGSFDLDRVKDGISLLSPAFTAAGHEIKTDLVPEDIVTNEFLDPSIALPDDVAIPENTLPDTVPGLTLGK